ncbi:hypothetical protein OF83DRAFT_1172568 [Amylostereum chailletii]|nr:hypothetical protein OF83DRAFT_1172568 [Amylostereum chailletii]
MTVCLGACSCANCISVPDQFPTTRRSVMTASYTKRVLMSSPRNSPHPFDIFTPTRIILNHPDTRDPLHPRFILFKMPPPFPTPYDFAIRRSTTTVLVGVNTIYIPAPPPQYETLAVHPDELWGSYEWTREPQPYDERAPYLICIPSPHIGHPDGPMMCSVQKSMWARHSDRRDGFVIEEVCRSTIRIKLDAAQQQLDKIIPQLAEEAKSHSSMPQVVPPIQAMERARDAYGVLISGGLVSWSEFVQAYRGWQRSMLEVTTFSNWWAVRNGKHLSSRIRSGAILQEDDLPLYEFYSKRNLPIYIEVAAHRWSLDPDHVERFPSEPITRLDGTLERRDTTVRNLAQWFYPPTNAPYSEFEHQACGVIPRSDTMVLSTRALHEWLYL